MSKDYIDILKGLMEIAWRFPDDLEIGEDISDLAEVKIIFDGYGYNEETDEQDDTNMESYAIFIHKDALNEGFEFPPHDLTPWALIHRPKEEVCIYAWYDVLNDAWEFSDIGERCIDPDIVMSEEDVIKILEGLDQKYFCYEADDE